MMRRLHDWLLRRWYGSRPVWFLIPFTWLFVCLTGMRRLLYRAGVLLPGTLPVPVIVIGNLTVGGSGKTPCTLWLCEKFRASGYRPGIITRGYGGASRQWPVLVTAKSNAAQVGDEAVLLAHRSGVPVAAGPDRLAAARLLIEQHQVNLILSDDGLQHYRLPRDANITMLDGARRTGNGWQLPAGPLRESASHLRDARFIVVKSAEEPPAGIPDGAYVMKLELADAISLSSEGTRRLADFKGQRVHGLAGIADPEQFFVMLERHGLQVQRHPLPDHAVPDAAGLDFGDGLPVLMTEKDAVKCSRLKPEHCWYIPAIARFSEADQSRLFSGLISCLHKP